MADYIPVAEAGQYGQIGIEADWGTAVPATVQLASVKLTDGPKIDAEKFKASGSKLANVIVFGQETGDIGFDGPATYEEVGYFIKSLAKAAAADIPSYTLQKGVPGGSGMIYAGAVVTAWTLKGDPKSVNVSGNIASKSFVAGTPTAGLSQLTQTPLENDHLTINLDGSAIANAGSWEMTLQDLWALAAFCGSNVPGGANEGDINGEFKLLVEATSSNIALISDRDEKTIELAFDDGGGNTFNVKANGKFFSADKFQAMGRVYALGLTYQLTNTVVAATTNVVNVA